MWNGDNALTYKVSDNSLEYDAIFDELCETAKDDMNALEMPVYVAEGNM